MAAGDLVKVAFDPGGKTIVHNNGEFGEQKISHNHPDIGRSEFAFVRSRCFLHHLSAQALARFHLQHRVVPNGTFQKGAFDITPILNGGNGRSVGGGTANAQFFQFFDQTCFGETRWRSAVSLGRHHALRRGRLPLS